MKTVELLAFFTFHNDKFEGKVDLNRSWVTYACYRIVCKHLRKCVTTGYQKEDIPLNEIQRMFVEGVDTWLCAEQRLSPNRAWCYMIAMKHIFKLARKEGLMQTNPFSTYVNNYIVSTTIPG